MYFLEPTRSPGFYSANFVFSSGVVGVVVVVVVVVVVDDEFKLRVEFWGLLPSLPLNTFEI